MTQAEKKMKNYVNAVERRLNLPREIKARVMSDFQSSIVARREAGHTYIFNETVRANFRLAKPDVTDEEIYAELGTPAKAAADLNEQMKDYAYRKSPWRFLFLGIAAIGGVRLLYDGFVSLIGYVVLRRELVQSGGAATIGIIGCALPAPSPLPSASSAARTAPRPFLSPPPLGQDRRGWRRCLSSAWWDICCCGGARRNQNKSCRKYKHVL